MCDVLEAFKADHHLVLGVVQVTQMEHNDFITLLRGNGKKNMSTNIICRSALAVRMLKDSYSPTMQHPGFLVHRIDVHHTGILHHSLKLHINLKGLLEGSHWQRQQHWSLKKLLRTNSSHSSALVDRSLCGLTVALFSLHHAGEPQLLVVGGERRRK